MNVVQADLFMFNAHRKSKSETKISRNCSSTFDFCTSPTRDRKVESTRSGFTRGYGETTCHDSINLLSSPSINVIEAVINVPPSILPSVSPHTCPTINMFRNLSSRLIHSFTFHCRDNGWHGSLSFYQKIACLEFQRRLHSSSALNNTIFSLSSGAGKSGVAVIRVSGPSSSEVIRRLCKKSIKPRRASFQKLYHPGSNDLLDKAIVLWFPAPQSFTGEDCVEFHVHGGLAVIEAVLSSLGTLPGLKPAAAGEFTKQAFINGKLDLTEVEGLGDLIHAETEVQRKQALRQLEGDLGQLYTGWRSRLIKCLANVEAYIDFAEEENIEDDVLEKTHSDVLEIRKEISSHLTDSRKGERLRDGVRVAIAGMPNAGKSSLLNIITQRPAAIVSPIAGTTRDVVETALNISGFPVLISDTAGLRKTDDIVEKEGVIRAFDRLRDADLKILLIDSFAYQEHLTSLDSFSKIVEMFSRDVDLKNLYQNSRTLHDVSQKNLNNIQDEDDLDSPLFSLNDTMIVFNKSDLVEELDGHLSTFQADCVCKMSCTTGHGLELFMDLLVEKIRNLCGNPLEGPPSLTQSRHRFHLKACLDSLDQFVSLEFTDDVLAAERLRMAARQIGHITGVVSAEDILDVLFRDFCIGK